MMPTVRNSHTRPILLLIYACFFLSGAAGTAWAGFLLLPRLGIFLTTMSGVLINLGIALLILSYVRPGGRPTVSAGEPAPAAPISIAIDNLTRTVLLAGFGVAGFAAMLWICPLADGGVNRFILVSLQPGSTVESGKQDSRVDAVESLAERIVCRQAGNDWIIRP